MGRQEPQLLEDRRMGGGEREDGERTTTGELTKQRYVESTFYQQNYVIVFRHADISGLNLQNVCQARSTFSSVYFTGDS